MVVSHARRRGVSDSVIGAPVGSMAKDRSEPTRRTAVFAAVNPATNIILRFSKLNLGESNVVSGDAIEFVDGKALNAAVEFQSLGAFLIGRRRHDPVPVCSNPVPTIS